MFKRKMNTKGQLGLNLAIGFMTTILGAVLIAMAILFVLNSMDATSVATNDTKALSANVTSGVNSFFSNTPTWFALLAVFVIIAIVVGLIILVKRVNMGSSSGGL